MAKKSFWRTNNGIVALIFIAGVSYFLLMEHRQHLFQWLPFIILALCPLMHIFMHGGHGGHDSHDKGEDQTVSDEEAFQRGLEEGRKQGSINSTDSTNHH